MPTESIHVLYKFDELSDEAKERAREWWRSGGLDYEWWDFLYEDIAECGKIIGIDIRQKPVKLMNGKTRFDPAIWFSGFYHQGSGSSFDGDYRYAAGSVKKIKRHAPQDADLHAIAESLYEVQRRAFYRITATIRSHRDTSIQVNTDCDDGPEDYGEAAVVEAMNDFNDWIYRRLRDEYEYLNSDESVDDTIMANEYTFDENGKRDD